eukprot:3066316-Pleurochrysis_carterae.AAC.1
MPFRFTFRQVSFRPFLPPDTNHGYVLSFWGRAAADGAGRGSSPKVRAALARIVFVYCLSLSLTLSHSRSHSRSHSYSLTLSHPPLFLHHCQTCARRAHRSAPVRPCELGGG